MKINSLDFSTVDVQHSGHLTVNPRDIHVTTVESSNLTEKDNSVNEHDAFFFKVLREEVESHLQDFMKIHLDLACVKLSDTENSR